MRFTTAAHLSLSFDEAYFWLWSKHLSLSYYDHPPLIALTIRAGTLAFGDTEFGVRAFSLLSSVAASWAIWRAAALLAGEEQAGPLACALFNATLMANSQFIAATPDALMMTAAAFLLLSLAKLQQTNDARWWGAVGATLGIGFLSKYTAFFLAGGVVLWCLTTPEGRRWLRTPWPYGAAILAATCFAPALVWNAGHNWISFKFQFGRVGAGSFSYRYVLEFALAQLALASPFILAAALAGLYRAVTLWRKSLRVTAAATMTLPALIYFAVHALHARVQGNWPSFIYPALAVLAAWEWGRRAQPPRSAHVSRVLGICVALIILAGAYLQTWTGAVVAGKQDPIARMMGFGVRNAAREIADLAAQHRAAAILTGKYVVSGWLSFYLPRSVPVVQIADEQRWLEMPKADARLLRRPLLYVTQEPARELISVRRHFSQVVFGARLARKRDGATLDNFYVYYVSGFHGPAAGRMVYEGAP